MGFFKKKNVLQKNYNSGLVYVNPLKEEEFIFLYKKMIMNKYANSIIARIDGEDEFFKFGVGGEKKDKLLGISMNFKEVVLNALANRGDCLFFVGKYEFEGNFVYLNEEPRNGVFKSGDIELKIVKGYTFKGLFSNQALVDSAISLIYNAFNTLKSSMLNQNSLVLKKKGLNAFFQNANPMAINESQAEVEKQMASLINGDAVVIDKEDEFGFLTQKIDSLQEAIDFANGQLAIMLEIPVNELTGQQYTNTLGSKGAESIDKQKSDIKYQFILRAFIDMLNYFNLSFKFVNFTANERLTYLTDLSNLKKFETDQELVNSYTSLQKKLLQGLEV